MKILVLALLLACSPTMGATYYIDYIDGNDAAAGTGTGTPWKRQPYMIGFTGTYVHAVGDRFIFKGGVTWPRSCFQMAITVGGSSGSVRDHYGVDQSWFTGGAWTQPVFDFEQLEIGDSSAGAGVKVTADNLRFDSIKFIRHRARPKPNEYLSFSLLCLNVSRVDILNCLVRDWDITPPIDSGDDGAGGGGFGCVGGTELVVSNCVAHTSGVAIKTGCALYGFPSVWFNTVYEVSNAYIGGGGDCTVHDNHIYNVRTPSDPISHANAILVQGKANIWNNLIHGVPSGITGIFLDCAFADPTEVTNLVYNNVVFDCGQVMACDNGGNSTNMGYRIYNNTLASGNSSYCIRTVTRLNGDSTVRHLGFLDIRNNHLITDGSIAICADGASAECGPVTTLIAANNLTQSVAQAVSFGYSTNMLFVPFSSSAPTVRTGTNLSSYLTLDKVGVSRASLFDIGAYQFVFGSEGTINIVRTLRRKY